MRPIPYKAESMDNVVLIGEDGTQYIGEYIDMRLDRTTIPNGKYAYDCRHDDDGDWVTPVTIEKRVMVNFAGTFVTDTPIMFPDEKYHYIPLKEWVI